MQLGYISVLGVKFFVSTDLCTVPNDLSAKFTINVLCMLHVVHSSLSP